MASTGSTAWTKYFKGQDVSTVMKKDSDAFDGDGKTRLNFKVKANEKVVVFDSDSYQEKAVIKRLSDNKICRVTFNNIQKPGRETSVNLKPQAFGIGDTKYNIEDYVDLVLNNIEDRTNLSPETKNYLQSLVLYFAGFENLQFTQKAYNDASSLPLRDIKKDFGEILGPIAVIKKQILTELKIPKGNTTKIYMPARPNEPLMDYGIIVGNETYVISAKSGTTTNVVKPQDIINLLKKDATKHRKYQRTEQYKILESLSENGIVDGAIIAASKLPGGPSPEAAADVKKRLKTGSYKDDKYDIGLMGSFINSNDYLKKQSKPTLNQIMYECEKMIAAKSKNGLDFTPMFKDAVSNQVIYVKFDISASTPDFEVVMNDDFSTRKVTLRTKNGYTRRSDRMGIQV